MMNQGDMVTKPAAMLLLALSACAAGAGRERRPATEERPMPSGQRSAAGTGYFLDGKEVDQPTYTRFAATLTEVPHTWFCDEESDGGTTGYDGVDAAGVRYRVRSVSRSTGSRSTIERVPAP